MAPHLATSCAGLMEPILGGRSMASAAISLVRRQASPHLSAYPIWTPMGSSVLITHIEHREPITQCVSALCTRFTQFAWQNERCQPFTFRARKFRRTCETGVAGLSLLWDLAWPMRKLVKSKDSRAESWNSLCREIINVCCQHL